MKPKLTAARAKSIATAVALSFALWQGSAHAQDQDEAPAQSSEEAQPQIAAPGGTGEGPPGGPENDNHFAIGFGGAYMPAFQGSDKYRFQPLPAVDIKWGRFFVNFQDGIGANIIETEKLTMGAGLTMAENYRAKDVPAGIGELKAGLGARAFVKLRQGGFEAMVGGTKIITGSTEGFIADASLSYPIMVSEKFFLMPSVGTTWANAKHNNRYFGISEQQSVASGLPQFRVGSGFVDARAELGAQFRLSDRFMLGVVGGVTTLFGDVKNSPIVKERTRPFGLVFISYDFGTEGVENLLRIRRRR